MFSLVRLISELLLRSTMNDSSNAQNTEIDSMILLGIILPSSIWITMYLFLSIEIAWISFPCGLLVGFFLWLIALGYENSMMAKATVVGVLLNLILSFISAYYAFL
jgi:ABC-type transport system involved in cytochrome bd biosynthesis fused ATPase/permease subunit